MKQLTHLNDALFADKKLGEVRALPLKSTFDQRGIDAWLVTPPHFDRSKKYPLILEIHGGPYAAYGPRFSTDYQLYAAAGYVVLYANPRGSTSYGAEFANLIHHKYPSEDYDDLMSAVDAAIAEGYVDANNLFVTGGSGGGVLTAWIVGKTTRFKAAVTQKPVINWASTVLTTDVYTYMPKYWFGKLPWEDPEQLLEAVAAVACRRREDADARARRRSGLQNARQRFGAVLPGAAIAGRRHRTGESPWRVARRPDCEAIAVSGEGERDSGVVREIQNQMTACGRKAFAGKPRTRQEGRRQVRKRIGTLSC